MIETTYLVIGAGASGMAFVDTLLNRSDARVILVDRQAHAGGHWLDAYPFVRLHQPSATYGVPSRPLGGNRIDVTGPNAGFYEQATAVEICAYYAAVLDSFISSGRLQFLAMSDYLGKDAEGHQVVSRVTGKRTVIRAKTLVDATYVASEIPLRHPRPYEVDPDVRVIAPNEIVNVADAPAGFTIIGGGKTAMDTCGWLLQAGVDPDRIRWIRPRDPWLYNRACMQPLELVASVLRMQASWMAAAAQAVDGSHFAHLLEEQGVFLRLAPSVEPTVFRAATVSQGELDTLRSIERVTRAGRVARVQGNRIALTHGDLPTNPRELYIDCTAAGVRRTVPRPIFAPHLITLQYVTTGIAPWSAAIIGAVEADRRDVPEKNGLCPPVVTTGDIVDVLDLAHAGLLGVVARSAAPDLVTWNDGCRLNPAQGAATKAETPDILAAFDSIAQHVGPALSNLAQRCGTSNRTAPATLASRP